MKSGFILTILFAVGIDMLGACDAADDGEYLIPAVTADQVVDRATLKTFVEEARRVYKAMLENRSSDEVNAVFREEGGHWKYQNIYILILDLQGNVILHAGNTSLEGQNLYDREDLNGVLITQELIAAAQRGGGYLEYYFDNPAVSGDEIEGSLKVGYAVEITASVLNNGQTVVMGSGFYP